MKQGSALVQAAVEHQGVVRLLSPDLRSRGAVGLISISEWQAPSTRSALGAFARRAKGHGKADRTKYGKARRSTKSYYTHWCQRLANAAAIGNAKAIVDQTTKLKAKVNGAAQAAILGAAA